MTTSQGKILPPRRVWVTVAVCAALAVWVKIPDAPRPAWIDSGVSNVLAFVFALVAIMTWLVWFTFFSGNRRVVRMAPVTMAAVGIAVAASLLEISGWSGAMVPEFRWRGTPDPDQVLDQPPAEPPRAEIDLTTTTPDDFPQFLGPERRATVSHVRLSPDWASHPPIQVWRQPIGAGWSAFSVVNGFAVTMEQRGPTEFVTCYEVRSGAMRWSHGIEARHETLLGGVGPRGTPTIDQGRVYALGATGVLRCLDGASGQEIWIRDLLAMYHLTVEEDLANVAWGRAASPLIVDHMVVVPAGGPRDGRKVSLVALDKETGEVVWEGGDQQISYASPALATILGQRQILIVNESTVAGHAVDSGEELWTFEWKGQSNAGASTSQAVAVDDRRVFVSKGYGGGAGLFELSRSDAGAWGVDVLWKRIVMRTKFTNVAFRQGYVYGLDDGMLSCVQLETGRRRWKRGRYGHGQVLLVGDLLLVQTETGEIVMVEASPEPPSVLGRFQAVEGKSWNNPCLYGPFLLVRNAEEAACYRLPLAEP